MKLKDYDKVENTNIDFKEKIESLRNNCKIIKYRINKRINFN